MTREALSAGSRVIQAGRLFEAAEIAVIVDVVESYPTLGRLELIGTVAEVLGWVRSSGEPRIDACGKLLAKLEAMGVLQLPPPANQHGLGKRRTAKLEHGPMTAPGQALVSRLGALGSIRVEPVTGRDGSIGLWNEYVDRYHTLGYKKPFGCRLRYFIESDRGRLGCLLMAGAAKSMGTRDRWIGWSEEVRLQNLGWIVNNSRFLIFPWVQVRNLASHALAEMLKRLGDDWQRHFGYRPLLAETFVDPEHYRGSCYRGAGWELLGSTTGAGLVRPGKEYTTTPKLIFVKAVPPFDQESARKLLCQKQLTAWAEQFRGGTR